MTDVSGAIVDKVNGQYVARHGDDSGLIVRIYTRAVPDARESEKQGRQIFRDVPYIKINIPGDKLTEIDRKVTDQDKQRFARHWQAYQDGIADTAGLFGTPIDQWPILTPGQVEELKALNIRTVEAMANLLDSHVDKIPRGRSLRDRARAFIEAAKTAAPIEQLSAENDRLREKTTAQDATITQLQQQMADMGRQMAELRSGIVPAAPAKPRRKAPKPKRTPSEPPPDGYKRGPFGRLVKIDGAEGDAA